MEPRPIVADLSINSRLTGDDDAKLASLYGGLWVANSAALSA
jgi:hypothetical protein